jgi:hypothetical protein
MSEVYEKKQKKKYPVNTVHLHRLGGESFLRIKAIHGFQLDRNIFVYIVCIWTGFGTRWWVKACLDRGGKGQ